MPTGGSSREQATKIDLALDDRELPLDLIVVTPEQSAEIVTGLARS
jgi:hypothetical protein